MDKLNKLAMPDVKSGTPQEKMNAVKKALQSLEMLTEAYNQIVPVINAKIDWLNEAEKVAKDDTQDKKIDELIAVNKLLLGRINSLESKGDYDDSEIVERISKLELKPDYKYDDKPLKKMVADITKQQGELSSSQNELGKAIKAIKIPKVPSVEPLRKRIKALEDKPQYVYDDKELKGRIKTLEDKPQHIYDDRDLKGRVALLENKPQYTYNDKPLIERIKKLESVPKYAYDDSDIKDRINTLEVKPQYDDKELKVRIKALEEKPAIATVERYDDSELVAKLAEIEGLAESLDKRVDYLKRTYSEKWALQQIEVDKVKTLRDEIDSKIEKAKSYFTCSCDAQSALKVADYTRRTMTEKYTAQQFQIDKIQSMLSK